MLEGRVFYLGHLSLFAGIHWFKVVILHNVGLLPRRQQLSSRTTFVLIDCYHILTSYGIDCLSVNLQLIRIECVKVVGILDLCKVELRIAIAWHQHLDWRRLNYQVASSELRYVSVN